MRYRVTAEQRKGWPGRWRSGRYFVAGQWTELDVDEVTDAMRADPVLIIEPLPEPEAEEAPAEKPGGEEPASEGAEVDEPAVEEPADVPEAEESEAPEAEEPAAEPVDEPAVEEPEKPTRRGRGSKK